jgi:peroxisomal 2,4-dienoyl-CoA reductase
MLFLYIGAAGNFLAPAAALSFNAFKTVMEIDAHGTFNVSKVVYDKYLKVFIFFVK